MRAFAALFMIASVVLLSGCNDIGNPSGTYATTTDNGAAGATPGGDLNYKTLVSGLMDGSVEIHSDEQLYRIYESGLFSGTGADVAIATQPTDTKCFLFRQYDDDTEMYLECYDRSIGFSDVAVPVGSFVNNIPASKQVLYSSEELVFVEDKNASNGYSHVATDDSGLFYIQTDSLGTAGYFTDAAALGGAADYFAIEQELFALLQNSALITSIETVYTHEVVGVLYDVEYHIRLSSQKTPMGLVSTLAQTLKSATDGTTIEHLPYGYEGSVSSDYILGATVFPSSSANTFYALRAATEATLGTGNHFPTTNIENGD